MKIQTIGLISVVALGSVFSLIEVRKNIKKMADEGKMLARVEFKGQLFVEQQDPRFGSLVLNGGAVQKFKFSKRLVRKAEFLNGKQCDFTLHRMEKNGLLYWLLSQYDCP